MRNVRAVTAGLIVLILVVSLCGNVYALSAVGQVASHARGVMPLSGGTEEEEGDIDVPFEPIKTVRSISIITPPSKLKYLQGEPLDLTGMVVKAYYNDNTNAQITDYQVSGYSPDVLGEQTVKVSVGNRFATFKVTVVVAAGDVDGNNSVDNNDATLLLQYAAGWDVDINTAAADINGDGIADGWDATLLLQHLAGKDVTLGESTSKPISESAWLWKEKNQAEGYYDVAYIDFTTQYIEHAAYYHEDECPAEYTDLTEQIFDGETYLRLGGTGGTFPSFDNETPTTITVYPYEGETCRIDFELVEADSLMVTYIDEDCSDFTDRFAVGTILTRLS